MATNEFEMTINAPVEEVWKALTTTALANAWMGNVQVETDWKEGANIVYTCYDDDGSISQWEGQDMAWEGIIAALIPDKEFTCDYSGDSGLEKETYLLEKLDDKTTKLRFVQDCVSQEMADAYKAGIEESNEQLKTFLEK